MACVADGFSYDVFLSFRGEDTRYGFTGNLWKALKDRGIHTFMDDEELRKGEEITPSLIKAIQQSRMAIIVLSKNYASSSFCLQELSTILDHNIKEKRRLVWPVFYDVDPSDVRKLKRTYGEAMAIHETTSSNDGLQKWKSSLHQVANLSGFHFKNGDGYEHEFIGKIVEQVSREIKPVTLPIADYLVGVESQKQNVTSLLNVGSDDRVYMVGIHGIGGIGKTTLALTVYNLIAHQFEASCFLEKVRENSEKHGLLYLQKIILSVIVGEKKIDLTSVKQGISVIQQRLRQKKVLLILDDVDKEEQLHAIAGKPDWFSLGSRVIITTRDKGLLTCHRVESTYEMKELNWKDASELLRRKAFKTDKVSSGYADVLRRAVTYASGLPLALEVIGSHLFNKTVEQCNVALDRYERIPDKKIQTILKLSFDALEEEEKSVFLDIACCFKGYKMEMVEKILFAHHGDNKKHHISVLVEKSLIKISESGKVTLHDLIEDMGKEIVRQESPEEPGKRSRLWFPEDIVQVFEENTGTGKIEIIHLDSGFESEIQALHLRHRWVTVKWDGQAFQKMKKLRTLIVRGGHFSESPKHLPNSLRVLELKQLTLWSLPSDFYPKKLAICTLSVDLISSGWGDFYKKKFKNMRFLYFHGYRFLTRIPDISGLLHLEELSVYRCENLVTIDDSVGLLGKLKILRISFCTKLRSLPPLKLTSLEEFDLSCCGSLKSLQTMTDGSMEKLKILSIKSLSSLSSIPPLKLASLEKLNLAGCYNLESFPAVVDGFLNKLKILSVTCCKKLRSIPPLKLASLEKLNLASCDNLESFPPVVDELLNELKILTVTCCNKLRSIPPLKLASLEKLNLASCDNLESFPSVVDELLNKLKIFSVTCCNKLRSIPPLKLASLEKLNLAICDNLENFPPVVDGLLDNLKVLSVSNCKMIKSIPALKLALLEELHLECCDSLESLPPMMNGSLDKLKILRVKGCNNLKSIPPLKLPSVEKIDLSHCGSLECFSPVVDGLMDKLKILSVESCSMLRNIPPIKFSSLQELNLSKCQSLESFPLVLDRLLEKFQILSIEGCFKFRSIPPRELALPKQLELSCCGSRLSFQQLLVEKENIAFGKLCNCGIAHLPSGIIVVSELAESTIKDVGWLYPKQDEGEEKVSPMQAVQIEFLCLCKRYLSNESLAIGLKWFSNVKELYLSENKFTILPECIENCHSLWKLVLDKCEELREIKGIPPSLKILSAFNCKSLTSSCKSKLLNQELHEAGNTWFRLPRAKIPDWFDHQCMAGLSITFWFRNKFPTIALCVVSPLTWDNSGCPVRVIINGNTFFYRVDKNKFMLPKVYHLHLFHMQMKEFNDNLDKALLENKWNHAEVDFGFPFQKSGIHVLKEKSSMKDIRFTNPENDIIVLKH